MIRRVSVIVSPLQDSDGDTIRFTLLMFPCANMLAFSCCFRLSRHDRDEDAMNAMILSLRERKNTNSFSSCKRADHFQRRLVLFKCPVRS